MKLSKKLTLEEYANSIDDKITNYLEYAVEKFEMLGFLEPMIYSFQGGKKLRPALTLLIHQSLGGDFDDDAKLKLACAGELIQSSSLVIDDMLDGDKTRRGAPTMHMIKSLGESAMGAIANSLMALMFGKDSPHAGSLELLIDLCHSIIIGNDLDTKGYGFSMDTYLRVIGLKTASLFSACAELGCIDFEPAVREKFKAYGSDVGMAFQLTDDLVDVLISVKTTRFYRDLKMGKLSYPIILLYEDKKESHQLLQKYVDKILTPEEKLELLDLLNDSKYVNDTKKRITNYIARAKTHLPEGMNEDGDRLLKEYPRFCNAKLMEKVEAVKVMEVG